jgi:hypothetical protein
MKFARWVAVLAIGSTAAADEVDLKSGGRLSGIVREERANEIVVETALGMVTVARKDVASIDKNARSVVQDYYDRLKEAKTPEDFESLASWVEEKKLNRFVKEVKARAVAMRRKELEEKVQGLSGSPTADEIYELGLWARRHGLDAEARSLLERALKLNPDHEMARRELGFKRFEGKWLTDDEVMLAKGFVKFEDKWVTESQKELILAERAAKFQEREKKIKDEERRIADEKSKLKDKEADLARREQAAKKELAETEAEQIKLKKLERQAADREAFLIRVFGDPTLIQPCATCKVWWSRANFQSCPFCDYKKKQK